MPPVEEMRVGSGFWSFIRLTGEEMAGLYKINRW
jgi:hypothetical protein